MNKLIKLLLSVFIVVGIAELLLYFNPQHPLPLTAATPFGLIFYSMTSKTKANVSLKKGD